MAEASEELAQINHTLDELEKCQEIPAAELDKEHGLVFDPEVKRGIGLTTRLNRVQIKNYLSNVHLVSKKQLIQDLESIGFEFKGGSKDGRFMEFIDKYSNIRIKVHPPDNVGTDYHHIHIYDKNGSPLNSHLEVVSYKSPEAHIKITDLLKDQSLITKRNNTWK